MAKGNASNNKPMTGLTLGTKSLAKILNYCKVRREVPAPASNAYRTWCKFANSMYTVMLSMTDRDDVTSSQTPFKDNIGRSSSIISQDMYNRIRECVLDTNTDYYSGVDEGRVDVITELICGVICNSATLYAMWVALWRTQTGYLYQDEDDVYMSPVLLNHDSKGLSVTDWGVTPGNNSFTEEISESSITNQQQLQTSGQVWGCMPIGNEPWANRTSEVLANTFMSDKMRRVIEHMFGNIFANPTFSYNLSTVTFFPCSTMIIQRHDSNDDWKAFELHLAGYENYFDNGGWNDAIDEDNVSTFTDIENYINTYIAYVKGVLNYYPQIKKVLSLLGFKNYTIKKAGFDGSMGFDFTRDMGHKEMHFIASENIQDFIQSTSYNRENLEAPNLGARLSAVGTVVGFTVKDQELLRYSTELQYADDIAIDPGHSLEYAFRGKIQPKRFAYYGADNDYVGFYRYQYIIPSMVSSIDSTAVTPTPGLFTADQATNIMYLNSDLVDFGAIMPLENDEYNGALASGSGAPGYISVIGLRCFWNPVETLPLECGNAWDNILID